MHCGPCKVAKQWHMHCGGLNTGLHCGPHSLAHTPCGLHTFFKIPWPTHTASCLGPITENREVTCAEFCTRSQGWLMLFSAGVEYHRHMSCHQADRPVRD